MVKSAQCNDLETLIPSFSVDKSNIAKFKHYLVGINAILRKTAENSGVNVNDLAEISTQLIKKIDELDIQDTNGEILEEIVISYCNTVAAVTNYKYSTPVIKAIMKIEGNLKEDLSLKALAKFNNISAGHFSALFKREVGITLTDYVNQKRIAYSKELLAVCDLKIKDIAEICGFADHNYFIRTFKKYEGITPKKFKNQKEQE